ncbi:radical SAM protein [Candidatus Woesearchaeota archaeon]|nr:radical SAM protein [Candidatus Woesearchaeota archaeon]
MSVQIYLIETKRMESVVTAGQGKSGKAAKVLIVVFGHLFSKDGKADGTRIRCFEMAKALKRKGHDVTIAQTDVFQKQELEDLRLVCVDKNSVGKEVQKHDVIITYPNEFLFTLSKAVEGKPLVIDLYDPRLLSDLLIQNGRRGNERTSESAVMVLKALSLGDLFLCANQNQKLYYTGLLNLLGLTGGDELDEYDEVEARDVGFEDNANSAENGIAKKGVIRIVPFGTPNESITDSIGQQATGRVSEYDEALIKGNLVDEDTKVVLWPGEFYPWFEPEAALHAMEAISANRDDVVLVFVGSEHFQRNSDASEASARLKSLAEESGLLGKKVFFLDWLAYSERWKMYAESDLAVVTSRVSLRNSSERELSCRTRLADIIWGELPVVCVGDDLLSKKIEMSRGGMLVDSGSLAEAILDVLDSPGKLDSMKTRMKSLKEEMSWDNQIKELDDFCKQPSVRLGKGNLALLDCLPSMLQEKIEHTYQEKQRESVELCEKHAEAMSDLTKRHGEEIELRMDEIRALQQQMEDLQAYSDNMAAERDCYKEEAQKIRAEADALVPRHDSLLREHEHLCAEKEVLFRECETLKREVSWRQEALDSIYNSRLYKYLCAPVWKAHNRMMGNIRDEDAPVPQTMVMLLNTACNLNCSFCRVHEENGDQELGLEEAERILSEARGIGVSQVVFTGGEPLLHKEFFGIVKKARDLGMAVNVTTNATLIKPLIGRIEESGIDSVSISIDGLKATHDLLRNKEGVFDAAMDGLKALADRLGPKRVNVHFVVTNKNVRELKDVYDLTRRMKVKFDFWPVNGSEEHYLKDETDKKAYKEFLDYVEKTEGRGFGQKKEYYLKGLDYHTGEKMRTRCLGLRDSFGINAQGELVACCLWGVDGLKVGNALSTPLRSLWMSEKAKRLRSSIVKDGCSHDCFNHALYEYTQKTGKSFVVRE